MRGLFRTVSALLALLYVGDLLLKKFFLGGFYGAYALPETAAYLALFLPVGFFLLSIYRFDAE